MPRVIKNVISFTSMEIRDLEQKNCLVQSIIQIQK